MVTIQLILRISTIIVSLLVVCTPIFYPKHSMFTRRAVSSLNMLRQTRETHDGVRLAYSERGEAGFKQLVEAVEVAFGYRGNPKRICLAVGKPKELGDFTGFGMEYGVGDNGVLYTEEMGAGKELLRWEPWSPTSTLDLERLSRGIHLRAQERSHTATATMAVLWATLSIVIVV